MEIESKPSNEVRLEIMARQRAAIGRINFMAGFAYLLCLVAILGGGGNKSNALFIGGVAVGLFTYFFAEHARRRARREIAQSKPAPQPEREETKQVRLLPLLFYIFGIGLAMSYFTEWFENGTTTFDFAVRILGGGALLLCSIIVDHRCKKSERQP